jgi:hypothetical protein
MRKSYKIYICMIDFRNPHTTLLGDRHCCSTPCRETPCQVLQCKEGVQFSTVQYSNSTDTAIFFLMKDALVPEGLDDFRSVQFWDGFFRERGAKAFEWYGDWRQLKPFFTRDCKGSCETLVVGCGNSELSADL